MLLLLLALYHNFELSWKTFVIFILVPDLSMAGYLKNVKLGATVYNLGHNYLVPVILIFVAMATDSLFAATLSVVWAIHISLDRAVGLGLKSPKGFKYTHLGRM